MTDSINEVSPLYTGAKVPFISPHAPNWAPHDENTRYGLDDQPTKCPGCCSRTEAHDNNDGTQNHTCSRCGFRFVGDWDQWTDALNLALEFDALDAQSEEMARIAARGPRPELPEWATDETKTKAHAFMDYMERLESVLSEKKWAKVLKFVRRLGEDFAVVEKAGTKKYEKARLSGGEEHGAAAALLNAYTVASVDSLMISLAILTGVRP